MGMSRAERERRQATAKAMNALLRSPRTRRGLIAMATKKGFSADFVYGWLAQAVGRGEIAKIEKKGCQPMYVTASRRDAAPHPEPSIYPAWMDPATPLPKYISAVVYVEGVAYKKNKKGQLCPITTEPPGSSSTLTTS